jgi:hypothetical protein
MSAIFDVSAASAILKEKYTDKNIYKAAFRNNPFLSERRGLCRHGKPYDGNDHCLDIDCVAKHIHDS